MGPHYQVRPHKTQRFRYLYKEALQGSAEKDWSLYVGSVDIVAYIFAYQ